MTNPIERATAKAAADRQKAIERMRARIARSRRDEDEPTKARIDRAIGMPCGPFVILATCGHVALLSRPIALPAREQFTIGRDAVNGPSIPIPAALRPALRRIMTCAPGKAASWPGCVRVRVAGERLQLETLNPSEGCEAREWMPADGAALEGRNVAVNGALLREAIDVVGESGRIALAAPGNVRKGTRDGGHSYEPGPLALLSNDGMWAVVIMGMAFPGKP